jgi:DeoR family deoxyribose operon repressor
MAFYSAAGVHIEQGVTCFNLEELPVKHWAMASAQFHVLVVDHSKFGKVRPACMGDLAILTPSSATVARTKLVEFAKAEQIKLVF